MNYNPQKIEKKWQKRWEKSGLYRAKDFSLKPKFYVLVEFPYPSGAGLHVGHLRSYSALDSVARFKRLSGYNVLFPMGWDAFGLPTENYAIKMKRQPAAVTRENIAIFKKQIKSIGLSFDWSREINTTDPDYYRWTQWIFLQLYKKGLAYRLAMPINWCPACKIGLANEEVVAGKCERCGASVEKRQIKQWLLAITKYAERLIKDLDTVDYLEKIKIQQINWIGKSEGAVVKFKIINHAGQADKSQNPNFLEVFTTRPDTLFGATFMVVSPEHELVQKLTPIITNWKEVLEYIKKAQKKSDLERTDLAKEKTGIELKGIKAINPVNNSEIPIFAADYVLVSYGTGAIMAVPAHDQRDWDFAKKYKLPVVKVIKGADVSKSACEDIEKGIMINSGQFNGMPVKRCITEMTQWLKEKNFGRKAVNYKLRDWVFSRQHYWGEPIPVIHCKKCGEVPVPEKDLPVVLPKVKNYEPTDTGESPLAAITDWVQVKCPKCKSLAKRETDTMPNWAGSSWYFFRYLDPKNNKALADPKKLKYWMPVDLYNGGMEHTTLHLLYSRFWNKFLYDIAVAPTSEPYARRRSHGMVLAEDSQKMSKSRGNVVNPDEAAEKYGADTLRLYEMFMGPFGEAIPWSVKNMVGVRRFLNKAWTLQKKASKNAKDNPQLVRLVHQTIKKVTEDIENFRFNTAVSALMILVNELVRQKELSIINYQFLIILLSPFAPHIAEELWERLGRKDSVCKQKWPQYDKRLVKASKIELVIQINGKVRDRLKVEADISETGAQKRALASEKIKSWLKSDTPKKIIFVPGKLINIVV